MSRSLVGISAEITEKEDQARIISRRLVIALQKKEPFQDLTSKHNELYDEIQDLIDERAERVKAAKIAVEENKSKIFSEDGMKVAELKISVSDVIFMLFKLYGIRVECKENSDGEWISGLNYTTVDNDEITNIRAIK